MVEEFSLPKSLRGPLVVGAAGLQLEAFYKMEQIARCSEAFDKKVEMIGHNAIGVYGKTATSRFRTKHLQQPRATPIVYEDFVAIKAADRDEIELLTNVANGIEANIFGAEHGSSKDRSGIVAESDVSALHQEPASESGRYKC